MGKNDPQQKTPKAAASQLTVTFLGAAGTVTGSKYLVEWQDTKILVDAGMFQGDRKWREENWVQPTFDLANVACVLLTHAHIDHTGILPRYRRFGLRAPIFGTRATNEITRLMLLDAAKLQEEEAQYRLETGRSRHHPPQPLYRVDDAEQVLQQLRVVPYHKSVEVAPGVSATWRRMGHILGACSIELTLGGKTIVFSGDIGRYSVPILKNPEPVTFGNLLLIESTYGDKLHSKQDPAELLGQVVVDTVRRGGIVLIPSFAVGRTQLLLYYLRELKAARRIPDIPVIIDSPMARDATGIYVASPDDYDAPAEELLRKGIQPFSMPSMRFIQDRNESKQLNGIDHPMVIISASGMLSGGRILHHLKNRLPDPRNTLLFVGHQPEGGRGDWIKSGNKTAQILGEEVQIRSHVAEISGLSAHGDRDEMLRWCGESKGKPGKVYVVHGEPETAQTFAKTLASECKWNVSVAEYQKTVVVE